MINKYRKLDHIELKKQPIIQSYLDLLSGKRKTFPRGTWELDENIVIIVRYVLEIKLQLSEEEIPKITRRVIKEQKLWGAHNRFKSVRKLLQFVYLDKYNEFDFLRVPVGYWDNIENIRKRLEYHLHHKGSTLEEIPNVVTYDQLVEWGLSNPLKRHGDSPFQLIDTLYPNKFTPYQFRKIPQGTATNRESLKVQFFKMLNKENIDLEDAPKYVTQEVLIKHQFSGALSYFQSSPSRLMMYLFPNQFDIDEFNKTNRYWKNDEHVKQAITNLIKGQNIPYEKIPIYFTKKFLQENGLSGLLHEYNGSPIAIINKVYPNEFDITDFQRVPKRYWYNKENRINALRSYCDKYNIKRNDLPNLTRAYFRKYFPRFISVVDRHYESKFYYWIIEAFPEHSISAEEFDLHIGDDGKLCDSKEELMIHNFLVSTLKYASIKTERIRFANNVDHETYIPDWIIYQEDKKFIIEYFGMYQSTRFPEYTRKVKRKIMYYNSLSDYIFIPIMPEDFRGRGFNCIKKLLIDSGLKLNEVDIK